MKKRNLPNLPSDECEVFNLVKHVKAMTEPEQQEEYREPHTIRNLKNKIVLFQNRMDDLVDQKRKVVKDLKKLDEKFEQNKAQLRLELDHLNERLRATECSLRATIADLRKEIEHL